MTEAAEQRKTPWPLIIIVALTVLPVIGAYFVYYTGIGVPRDTVNEGLLLEPAIDMKTLLAEGDGPVPEFTGGSRKWRIFIPVDEQCDEACQQNLYTTRQVHIRLGREVERIERYAINLGGEQGRAYLQSIAAEHPHMEAIHLDPAHWADAFAATNLPEDWAEDHYYVLADQVGFAVLAYSTEHHGNQLLEDIKRVLRYTPED